MTNLTRVWLIVIGLGALLVIGVVLGGSDLLLTLRTQVPVEVTSEIEQRFSCEPPATTMAGEYNLTVTAADEGGEKVSQQVVVNVLGADVAAPVVDDGGNSGSGGGVDVGVEPELSRGGRTFIYQVEKGHRIMGSYSRVDVDGARVVAVIAHERAIFDKRVSVPKGDYWLYMHVKHDRPGPVDVAVYVNNRAWKVVRFNKNDNSYRTHRIGKLRDFAGATIRYRFLNDVWEPKEPNNEEKDRNLYVDWWALSENSTGPKVGRNNFTIKQSKGINILPRLNSIIRKELGPQFINFDIWYFYAKRLVVVPTALESIQSENHLRQVMRYWQGVNPLRPRGL